MDPLAPSAYHDPREVVWKHLVAQAYWQILAILDRDGVGRADFDEIRFAFLTSFNGQHDVDLLCRSADAAASRLLARLAEQSLPQTVAAVAAEVDGARTTLRRAIEPLQSLRHVDRTQSYVLDGSITIAGKSAEQFAANPDYIGATLELVGEQAAEVRARAAAAWWRGFVLDRELLALVRGAAEAGWAADDLLAEVLLHEQRSGAYPSLREYEYLTDRSPAENHAAKVRAIEEGYGLLGRLMSCVASMAADSAPIDARALEATCPVAATLKQAGLPLTEAGTRAFRQFMLVHSTHGLNPGEFTARIASSVRTTFPQALIASLMVRAGKVHAGALPECMRQMGAYLRAPSGAEFAKGLLRSGVLFGFGHRIHKRRPLPDDDAFGGDPRVAFQIAMAREAFPEKEGDIRALEEFAATIRRIKPALAPNTDFGAAVWFHCLGVSPRVGSGMFSMNRLPGLVAQVINQLDYKANALRPPLAVNLPYSA